MTTASNATITTVTNVPDAVNDNHAFKIGDLVSHGTFGNGKIEQVNGHRLIIRFSDNKLKMVLHNFVSKAGSNSDRFQLTWFDDIADSVPKEMIIKGAFGVKEFTTVSGLPGTGKSVILTDAACHVACGLEWQGRKVKKGLVVYVAAERKILTERRMLAFRKRHGVAEVPLLVIGGRVDLTKDLTDARAIADVVNAASAEVDAPCVWIILDTLTRVFGSGDQNASKDMGKFIQSCDEIMDATGAHVTAVHHTGWSGERAKGAIDLDGAVDASFLVKKNGGAYQLVCDGTNDGEDGTICHFRMESVEVGVDEDGEPTTAPVVVPAANAADGIIKAETGYAAKALEALVATIESDGIEPEGEAFPDDIRVVKEGDWRAAFYASQPAETTPDTLRKRFKRAKESLIARQRAAELGQWCWVTHPDTRT